MTQTYLLLIITIALNIFFLINFDRLNSIFNFYDYPEKKRKIHKIKISLLGGSIFFICLNIYLLFDYFYFNNFMNFSYISLLLSFSLIFILGIIDDKKDLKALTKSIFFIIIILISIIPNKDLVIHNLNFSFFENEINLNNYSFFFTILCIYLFINAFNMYDGINGQAGIYIIIIFSYLFYKGILFEMSLSFLICTLFFLYLNLKNKLFLGDNGSLLISILISIIVIKSYNENLIKNCDEIFILMMLPGIDMARLFIERAIKKKNPLIADGNHFHHILLKRFKLNNVLLINLFLVLIPIILLSIGVSSLKIIISFLFVYLFMFVKLKKN
tara:strand:- start:2431 stop:3417 length:987 start_codon:yes stop_codon:yes gene_type:complete